MLWPYGMVLGVLFIITIGVVIMILGLIGLSETYRKKGNHD
jgi:hypothetical protein